MLLLCMLTTALAGVPVVFDSGDPTQVPAQVAARTGLPTSQLDATPLRDLLAQPPQALGDAVMRRCTSGPGQMTGVQSELVRAEAAWSAGQPLTALDHLDLAVAQLGCLGELVDPAVAARVFLLRGALEADADRIDAARGEFRTALAFSPDLAWDSRFPPAGAIVLVEEQAGVPAFGIGVVPAGTSSGPWVDGRTIGGGGDRVAVSPGLHLAQYPTAQGIRSAWMVVGGDTTLVLPGSFREPILERIADAETRPPLERLLQATIPRFSAAYVAHGGGVWLVALEGDALVTSVVAEPPPPVIEDESTKGKKKKKAKKKKGDDGNADDASL